MRNIYTYWVDKDERGEFAATVYNDGVEVCRVNSDDNGEIYQITDGWMRHSHDVKGLAEYLKSVGIMGPNNILVGGELK